MSKLTVITDRALERALDLAHSAGDGLKSAGGSLRNADWIKTGAAIGAVKTGGKAATKFVRRNPAVAVAAAAVASVAHDLASQASQASQTAQATAPAGSYAQLSQDLSRYALTLRVYQVITRNGVFDFSSNLEQVGDWQDVLIVDIGRSADGRFGAWTGWNSAVPGAINQLGQMANELTLTPDPQDPNVIHAVLPLPDAARALPVFGPAAQLAFTITNRDAKR